MLWALAVIADSGRAMYEAVLGALGDAEREALWQDYVRNDYFFDLVTAAEKQRGGTPTPSLTHRTASDFHPAR